MVEFNLICPKWHLGQVGHGGKKTVISYSVKSTTIGVDFDYIRSAVTLTASSCIKIAIARAN
jgi:hypothetical protein